MKNRLLVLLPVLAGVLTSCGQANHYGVDKYIDRISYDSETFKVLMLGDIHLGQTDILENHFKFMDLTINEADPDFIVLNGDTFTYADTRVVREVFTYINKKEIPWTFTYGNHDDQGYYSDHYLQEVLPTYSNCHFIDYDDDVSGRGNFVIDLVKNGTPIHQLYFMDSNQYRFINYFGYDYIQKDQVEWYKQMVDYSNKRYNALWKKGDSPILKSTMFMHIPLPEFKDAWDAFNKGEISGEYVKNEGFSSPEYNSGLFQAMLDYKSTTTICASHDHTSYSNIEYKGVRFVYGVHSTDRVYFDNDKLGGTLLTISDDSSVAVKHIFHRYEEVK